jgi:hypothetical protein
MVFGGVILSVLNCSDVYQADYNGEDQEDRRNYPELFHVQGFRVRL